MKANKRMELIIKRALLEILTDIESNVERVSRTYDAIIQCCIDKGEAVVLLSEVAEYVPYVVQADYPHSDLVDLEHNMALITTSTTVEGDIAISVRGLHVDEWQSKRESELAIVK